MYIGHNCENQPNAPSPWFVLLQFLGLYSNVALGMIGMAVIVDRFMPGRTILTELTVGAAILVWVVAMRKLGALPRPRRPRSGAKAVLFVFCFLSFSSVNFLFDLWNREPRANSPANITGTVFMAFLIAAFVSISEKGVWRDEPTHAAS